MGSGEMGREEGGGVGWDGRVVVFCDFWERERRVGG